MTPLRTRAANALPTFLLTALLICGSAHAGEIAEVHNLLADIDRAPRLRLKADLRIGGDDEDTALGRVADIAVNSLGHIFVLDAAFVKVLEFDAKGHQVRSFSRQGEGPGELLDPRAMAFDSADTLYVADQHRITVFDPSGEHIRSFSINLPGAIIRSVRIDANPGVLISAFEIFSRKILHRLGPQGGVMASFCDSYAVGSNIDVRVETTFAGGPMDVAPNGDICYSQMSPYEIRRFSPEGHLLMSIYRENDFITEPIAEKAGEGMMMRFPTGSYGLVTMPDGRLVNCVETTSEAAPTGPDGPILTIVDVFGADGKFLGGMVSSTRFLLKCSDRNGWLYGVELTDVHKVVRYVLE